MSPRTEETNARIREEQKERILEAAKQIFAHKGFTDTKMADIAAEAKVSYGLAYHYFANKEAIFTNLLHQALLGIIELMQRARMQPGTPWDRLRWLTEQIMQGAQEEPEFEMLVLQALTNSAVPEEIRAKVLRESRLSHAALQQLIEEGQAAGQVVAGDPDLLTTTFEWCIQGMVFGISYNNYAPTHLPDVEMALRMLKA
ncbi:MAG TPA: TetR/AcrR family transcriptional regulator [Ktedonobacteraceae bacterium]|nr:TetR/AcrR family transcriptional regulator [Ktedonobacteraceae bacterium]